MKTIANIEKWPESPGVVLEFWYIERGLLAQAERPSVGWGKQTISINIILYTNV